MITPLYTERLMMPRVEDGTFTVDAQGSIWRHFENWRMGRRRLDAPRRAEHRVRGGYLRVFASVNHQRVYAFAHRMVWQFFHGDIPEGKEINHRNAIPYDNRPENLELTTHSGNIMHAYHATATKPILQGEQHGNALFTDEQVIWMRDQMALGNYNGMELSKMFGCHYRTIYSIKSRINWRHLP